MRILKTSLHLSSISASSILKEEHPLNYKCPFCRVQFIDKCLLGLPEHPKHARYGVPCVLEFADFITGQTSKTPESLWLYGLMPFSNHNYTRRGIIIRQFRPALH